MKALLDLLFPMLCISCQKKQHIKNACFCVSCAQQLNYTDHFQKEENEFTHRFYGRVKLKNAAAILWYSKGDIVQKMVYSIKYGKQKHVGTALGELMAEQISNSPLFMDIDLIIPVPIHPKKKLRRGFNQSELLVKAISKKLNIPYKIGILKKKENTISQTHKSRIDRLKDIQDSIELNIKKDISHKNILLVDDVLTTGATLEACGLQLLKGNIESLSMLTIAIGKM